MKNLNQKNIAQLKNSQSVIERLTFALVEHGVEIESFSDIANYGAQNGYSAITYYSDTTAFYNANKDDIWDYATDQAEELGENVLQMIANFNGAKNVGGVYQFENLMTWYIAEEVSRYCLDRYKIPVS